MLDKELHSGSVGEILKYWISRSIDAVQKSDYVN